MPDDRKWKSLNFELKDWEESVLIYNHRSGSTHLLNPSAALTLELISKNSSTISEICQQWEAMLDVKAGTEITSQIQTIVESLDELGLIEPAEYIIS